MSSESQSKYISDLVVIKTKEFKEVKELLISADIVGDNAELVRSAQSIAEINTALSDSQASRFIDVLIATKDPVRDTAYSKKRVERTIDILESIKSDINDWSFDGL